MSSDTPSEPEIPPVSYRTPAHGTDRAATRGGRVRAALAAVRNLETLLRSPRVGTKVLRELRPELPATFGELREAFAENAKSEGEEALRAFVSVRASEVEDALAKLPARELDARARLALERVVARVAVELDAAGELLDMVSRVRDGASSDLSASAVGRASLELASGLRPRREMRVLVDIPELDAVVAVDARVVAQVVAMAAAFATAHAASTASTASTATATGAPILGTAGRVDDPSSHLVFRARAGESFATFALGPATPSDAGLPSQSARVLALIEPSLGIVREVAASMGGRFDIDGASATLALPRVAR